MAVAKALWLQSMNAARNVLTAPLSELPKGRAPAASHAGLASNLQVDR